jgi:hypothetical protein
MTKEISINGQLVRLFSIDGSCWFSSEKDARAHEQRNQKLLKEREKAIRRAARDAAMLVPRRAKPKPPPLPPRRGARHEDCLP